MRECRHIRKQFDVRLDLQCGIANELAFDEHVASCSACRQRWHQYVDIWQTVGRMKSIEPSTGFAERTLRRLDEAPATEPAVSALWWPAWRWAALACLIVGLSTAGWVGWYRAQTARRAAIYAQVQQADYLEDFDVIASLDQLSGGEKQL